MMCKMHSPRPILVLIAVAMYFDVSHQLSTPESKTYWAGVVEFYPEPLNQANLDRIEKTVTAYIDIIKSTEADQVDIMVFPEMTLNNVNLPFLVPDVDDHVSPCGNEDYDQFLSRLSCAARDTQKYLVVNVIEKVNVTDVENKDDGEAVDGNKSVNYNTNVVFDRAGVVISKYRKFHLFGESGVSHPDKAEIATFNTDFNVTFGHFICFDLIFKEPALTLLEKSSDIIFPTMWFSELPFLTAIQTQAMWAEANQVNFLSAGANNPSVGSTGSAIFSQNGVITAIMSPEPTRKLLVAEVLKKQFWDSMELPKLHAKQEYTPNQMLDLKMKPDHLHVYARKQLDLDGEVTEKLCYEDLCCNFHVVAATLKVDPMSKFYRYSAAVFDGVRTYDQLATGGTFTCAIISCTNDTWESCGTRFEKEDAVEPKWLIQTLEISGIFRAGENILTGPNTVNQKMLPLDREDYTYSVRTEMTTRDHHAIEINMTLTKPQSELYAFGIYGRDFEKDGQEPSSSFNNRLINHCLLVLSVLAIIVKYFD